MRAEFVQNKLFEIGEIITPLEFTYKGKILSDPDIYAYFMSSQSEQYRGIFIKWPGMRMSVYEYHFDTLEGGNKIINKGDFYKIMATNVHIIKDFRKRKKNPVIMIIGKDFYPGENYRNLTPKLDSRLRIYYEYIKKNAPEEDIYLIKNEDNSIKGIKIS